MRINLTIYVDELCVSTMTGGANCDRVCLSPTEGSLFGSKTLISKSLLRGSCERHPGHVRPNANQGAQLIATTSSNFRNECGGPQMSAFSGNFHYRQV